MSRAPLKDGNILWGSYKLQAFSGKLEQYADCLSLRPGACNLKLALGAGHAGAAGATLKRRGSIPRLDGAYTRRQSFVGRMGGRISDRGFALQEPPPHPIPLPQGGEGEREPIFVLFRPEFDSGKGADLRAVQT
ncbi:hypothetical protein PkoCFBP13504_29540 [Pseudomonas koreensis]|nr:hypothetical protein PkoCFBP13504_29540 [Pseudomonas koreensis]